MPRISPAARRSLVDERRKQILKAAADVFGKKGFERATVADIARQAGVAEGSIYNYFKNKDDLLVALPEQVVRPPIQAVATLIAQSSDGDAPSPIQVLDMLAHNFVAAARQNRNIFRILMSAMPFLKPSARQKYLDDVVMYGVGTLERYFTKQIEKGVFRQELEPRLLAFSFIGMFFPLVLLREVVQIELGSQLDYERAIQQSIPLFLRGVMQETSERNRK